jgi:hypothetical protein
MEIARPMRLPAGQYSALLSPQGTLMVRRHGWTSCVSLALASPPSPAIPYGVEMYGSLTYLSPESPAVLLLEHDAISIVRLDNVQVHDVQLGVGEPALCRPLAPPAGAPLCTGCGSGLVKHHLCDCCMAPVVQRQAGAAGPWGGPLPSGAMAAEWAPRPAPQHPPGADAPPHPGPREPPLQPGTGEQLERGAAGAGSSRCGEQPEPPSLHNMSQEQLGVLGMLQWPPATSTSNKHKRFMTRLRLSRAAMTEVRFLGAIMQAKGHECK